MVRTVISIEDYDRALAVGFNAVDGAGRHDVHAAGIDRDRLAIDDQSRLTARHEEALRIIVGLRRVRLVIELQQFEFSSSDLFQSRPPIKFTYTTNETPEN